MAEIGAGCGRWNGKGPWCAVAALVSVAGVSVVAQAQIPCAYEVGAIIQAPPGPLQASPTFPTAISPNGQHVVGWFNFDTVGNPRPWYWSEATGFIALPLPQNFSSATPSDINDNRVICGSGSHAAGTRGFIYDMNTGQTIIVPPAGGSWSGANAINNAGVVCGFRSIGPGNQPQTAFRLTNGVYENLGLIDGRSTNGRKINQAGEVSVSTGAPSIGAYARIWLSDSVINVGPVPDGMSSGAGALNASGYLLTGGIIQESPLVQAAFLFHPGHGFTPLEALPGETNAGFGSISSKGLIVGHSNSPGPGPSPIQRACFWPNLVATNLESVLNGNPGLSLHGATDVSDDSIIVVSAEDGQADPVAIVLIPVMPEAGDTNCDGEVNINDLLAVLNTWGACIACSTDTDGDYAVNINDLLHVLNHWGS